LAAAIHRGRWREAPGLGDRDRALCEIAEKLSRDPVSVGPGDWEPVRAAGLDDEGCLEVAHVVGVFNHLTRLADGLGLSVDPQTAAAVDGERLRRPAEDGAA
jgi:alkylhydroperoxidase family enzyme